MDELNVVNDINHAGNWLMRNQELLLEYTVNLTSAIIILIAGMFIAKIISNGVNQVLITRNIDVTIAGFLSALMRYIIITFTLIAALGRIGVQTTSVIAILGAAGMAIGLALQGSLSNFAAGVLLVTLRPLKTGEYVDLGSVAGTVLNIHIFYTTLRTLDGKIVVVPNNKIISGNIINYSREPARRNEFIISVSYNADIDLVIKVLRTVIENEDRVIKDRDIIIGLSELAPSSLNFIVRCWSNTNDLNIVYWDLMAEFKKALDKHNINIPYPQIDVHLYKKK
ncbi:MAG: small-conductance mechanosensitive channel MscS [Buchnera aphidicola (Brevicoryne brassicae)]|uniref:Small-conductance mechanosensitive channel n=1 Tax=Buchnera aphidicola (Brevicoryne brassicae) TaxID=911343 RepID=A0AAJ5TX68_9GAMM|nr:small-conductance mechanosensitive channel MscS [Buchnera aphidicola]QCI20004.1 small-conductance mechanosensitive channel MscS [Buchnera aphidicola (Brevicoryne brassicae)]WAI18828.1 MAG: small-conductance mechanosensitive channel MscS [Buchnera aphidicola (Brevicoryne brassicae)]